MNNFFLEPTLKTPKVDFDFTTGFFELSGRSIPENSLLFYEPIIERIKDLDVEDLNEINLKVNLEYFNTSSSKSLVAIFRAIEALSDRYNVTIHWYYDIEDEDMMESGEDFKNLLKVPFHLKKIT